MKWWLLMVLAVLAAGGARVAQAERGRAVGLSEPLVVHGLDPDTHDTAVLRWRAEDGVSYRLCASRSYSLANPLACFDIGSEDSWPVAPPTDDGAVLYLSLQACQGQTCAPAVRAGALGRRAGDGWDLYATAFTRVDGRTHLAGYVRAGQTAVRYFSGAAATRERLESACTMVTADQSCEAADVPARGALVGVDGGADGAGERGLTFQVQDKPTIYFMFDDGTGTVVRGKYVVQSVMDEYGVKGAFFLTGKAMQTYPSAVRALVAGGHRVGNHTFTHPFLTTFSDAAIGRELDQTEQQFRAIVPGGTLKPCFRAPNGDFNARVLNVVQGRGYQQYTQTVSSMDYAGASAGQIITNVMNGARDDAIVSFHTQEAQTAIALRTLIPLLLADGYRFGLVC